MKIATFNANSIRARLEAVRAWLQTHQPDVLCVQETKCEDKDFPALAFTELGYSVVFRGEKSYNGVALISKQKVETVHFGLDDGGPADAPRLLWARMGRLNIVNTYVPQGREIDHPMYQYKQQWLARLKAFYARHFTPESMLLWLGDLNVAREAMDIHNAEQQTEHVCYHVDVRRAFEDVVGWGFVDVFRKHHPEPGHYTFFDYRTINAVQRKMGWRIDYLLATQPLAKLSRDCWIDLEPRRQPKASDHTFLVAEFEV